MAHGEPGRLVGGPTGRGRVHADVEIVQRRPPVRVVEGHALAPQVRLPHRHPSQVHGRPGRIRRGTGGPASRRSAQFRKSPPALDGPAQQHPSRRGVGHRPQPRHLAPLGDHGPHDQGGAQDDQHVAHLVGPRHHLLAQRVDGAPAQRRVAGGRHRADRLGAHHDAGQASDVQPARRPRPPPGPRPGSRTGAAWSWPPWSRWPPGRSARRWPRPGPASSRPHPDGARPASSGTGPAPPTARGRHRPRRREPRSSPYRMPSDTGTPSASTAHSEGTMAATSTARTSRSASASTPARAARTPWCQASAASWASSPARDERNPCGTRREATTRPVGVGRHGLDRGGADVDADRHLGCHAIPHGHPPACVPDTDVRFRMYRAG